MRNEYGWRANAAAARTYQRQSRTGKKGRRLSVHGHHHQTHQRDILLPWPDPQPNSSLQTHHAPSKVLPFPMLLSLHLPIWFERIYVLGSSSLRACEGNVPFGGMHAGSWCGVDGNSDGYMVDCPMEGRPIMVLPCSAPPFGALSFLLSPAPAKTTNSFHSKTQAKGSSVTALFIARADCCRALDSWKTM